MPKPIPSNVLKRMKAAGAQVERVPGENLYHVTQVTVNDAACEIYMDWVSSIDGDGPAIGCTFCPTVQTHVAGISGNSLASALTFHIKNEGQCICNHYAQLSGENFAQDVQPVIPGPFPGPSPFIALQHPKIALSAIFSCLQHAPPHYPTLSALPHGSYVLSTHQHWGGALVQVDIFKA